MDPFDYCNQRAAENTPSLSCTVGGSGGRAGLPAVELQSPVIRENRETCSGCTQTIEFDIVQPVITCSDPLVTRYGQPGSMDTSSRGASIEARISSVLKC